MIENADALRDILDAPPNTKLGCRDAMILSVLYDTMIRADELIHLDVKDVQIDTDTRICWYTEKETKSGKYLYLTN